MSLHHNNRHLYHHQQQLNRHSYNYHYHHHHHHHHHLCIGKSSYSHHEIMAGFNRLDKEKKGHIEKKTFHQVFFKGTSEKDKHQIEVMINEMMTDLG